jgi:hypothetical protein
MSNIVKFCNAFDSPYSGAQTYHKNKIINLRSVSIYKKKISSFCKWSNN